MTFLNPVVLIGLIAAGIPVLLHLLNLQRLRTVEFSSLTFLKELQKTKIRRLKVKQLLLLLLRTLLILCIVLAFARPVVDIPLQGISGDYARRSVVVIMDDSFSMELADEQGERFKQAKSFVKQIVSSLKDGDEIALLRMANLQDKRLTSFTKNLALVNEEVQMLHSSFSKAKLEDALRETATLLVGAQHFTKQVFVITDAQKNILEQQSDSLKLFDAATQVFILPIGLESQVGEKNLSVDSINVLTKIFEQEKPIEIEATIRNNSLEIAENVIVSLFMEGERVAQRVMNIPAEDTRLISLAATPNSNGVVRASVKIEGDALEVDNERFFSFVVPEYPSVALVGDNEDIQYVGLALSPTETNASPITRLSYDEFTATDINKFDLIMLSNIPVISSNQANTLRTFMERGGSVVLFIGGKTNIEQYNSNVFASLGFGSAKKVEFSVEQPGKFSLVDMQHPLFAGVFENVEDAKVVESPEVFSAYSVTGGQSIISIGNNTVVAEQTVENGKIIVCGLEPTLRQSTFPITGIFVPFINRSVAYLSARATLSEFAIVNENLTLKLPSRYNGGSNLTIIDPLGTETFAQIVKLPSANIITLESLQIPGVYEIVSQEGVVVQTVAVNISREESELVMYDENEIETTLQQIVHSDTQVAILSPNESVSTAVSVASSGTELWQLFVALAILIALIEMTVARNTKQEIAPQAA